MRIIKEGSQEFPFKVRQADEYTCFTAGLKFELILNAPADTSEGLKVELLEWCYRKFYMIGEQRWLVQMLNNGQTFSKSIGMGEYMVDMRACEAAKNDPAVSKCFVDDAAFIQETSPHAMRNKFVLVDATIRPDYNNWMDVEEEAEE